MRADVERKAWYAPLVSLVLHGGLLWLAVTATRPGSGGREAGAAAPAELREREPEVAMIYVPPPKPAPLPKPAPASPSPPPAGVPLRHGPDATPGAPGRRVERPEPTPNAEPEAPKSEAQGTAPEEPEGDSRTEVAENTPSPVPTPLAAAPSQEDEAKRIFGRPRTDPRGRGAESARPWEAPLDWASRGCTVPDTAGDSTQPAHGEVKGRIIRSDNGQPLAGAHLQILGTPYSAFSNDRGEYRLVFDRKLVDNCRTQSVRVWARGYSTRDLILYLGVSPNSDVMLKRY